MFIDRLVLTTALAIALAACGGGASTTSAPASNVDDPTPSTSAPPVVPVGLHPGPGVSNPEPAPHGLGAPYPIVLMHGMAGFDKLTLPVDITYFAGVIQDLANVGEADVYVTVAPPYDTSEDRAAAIKPQIEAILQKTGKAKVNLVGHSQGGMDARVLASPAGFGMGDVIASVTTVATPHRGSRVADAVLGLLQNVPQSTVDGVTRAALNLLEKTAYDVQSDPHLLGQLQELSEAYMTSTFNPKYTDDPRVVYSSYGGRTNMESGGGDCNGVYEDDPSRVDVAQPMLAPLATFLQGSDGTTNDGLVTVDSARWGTFLQCVPADHLKEVGQIGQSGTDPVSGFDHLEFFRTVVARIRAAGL